MTPNDIDHAIEAMPDDEYLELSAAAVRHWAHRVERCALVAATAAVYMLLCYAAWHLVPFFWPQSVIAAAIATLIIVVALWLMLTALFSWQATDWMIRRATRRQWKLREASKLT